MTAGQAAGGDAGTDAAAALSRCRAPAGTTAPRRISDIVQLINALPMPLSLPCVLEALPRPFELHAFRSVISAQPAEGRRSPRLFLFYDGLILSVVPAGMGSHLLEFGQIRSPTHTLKGEIEFPVHAQLGPQAPYDRILYQDSDHTTCGFCHPGESQDEGITFTRAFSSQMMLPTVLRDRVSVEELLQERRQCDAAAEPERCAMLASLFDQGTPVDKEFPKVLVPVDD